jgi:hypothetical protein
VAGVAMRVAYADPPYLGQGARHYGRPEWDQVDRHAQLITQLVDEYPDGWALSASSPSLRVLLPQCPVDVRIAAWVKPFCAFKRGVRPAYGWEPVIFRGGRNRGAPVPAKGGRQLTPKDFHAASITLQTGLTGAKPESFCRWVLWLLNVQPGDRVDDLFPGTGVMGRVAADVCVGRELLQGIE